MRSRLVKRMEDFLSCRLAEDHPESRSGRGHERPAVTLSREAGIRGLEIGAKLADYLSQFDESAEHGWAVFDQSLLALAIERGRIPETLQPHLEPETSPEPPISAVAEMQRIPQMDWTMMQHTINAVRRLCRLGNVIVVGRGGNFITRDLPNAFHVRLVSPRADRSRDAAESLCLPADEAGSWIDSADLARQNHVHRHLGARIDDPAAYHLTLNCSRLGRGMTASLIGDALLEWACSRRLTAGS